ncbi:MAG: outer membrane lipoprotein LolB [Synechococcaceae cyanobacterium SM1_2_3]|nr:outer membrane lipoprotein LolB [Synechococcaceae cyanobacterium SM1_2_3]
MRTRPVAWLSWVLLSLFALLAGCATPPVVSPAAQSAWTARQVRLLKLNHWRTVGRIGVVNEQDGWHANFQWDQQGSAYRIDLIGPLGQGRVLVQGDAETVSIQTQDGQNWTASDADALLEQSLGIQLPVNGLRYWVRGLPEPGASPVVETDAEGRLIHLEQNGWIIDYPAYAPATALDLPARIIARRTDLSVKLVIEQWNL